MHFKLDFEGNNEIGVYVTLTNKYCLVGTSQSKNVLNFFKEKVNFPVVETTINSINTVGSLCVGNSNGLLLSENCTDQEMMHIRNSLPPEIRVQRVCNKLNALGNIILCNDHVCIANVGFDSEEVVEDVLKVPVYKMSLGKEPLVGSFAALNSTGMMVHPNMEENELKELSELLKVKVICSTINQGKVHTGSGVVVNDFMAIVGAKSSNIEIQVAETIFGLTEKEIDRKILKEEIIE